MRQTSSARRAGGPERTRTATMASQADRHRLYQLAVQNPGPVVDFMLKTYKSLRGKPPRLLREDFCGTAYLATEWCKRSRSRRALGVDISAEPLAWGRRHNLKPAGPEVASRVQLVQADVRQVQALKADITCAFNFSYCIFETRAELRGYFESVRAGLGEGGLFFADLFGGTSCNETLKEETELDGEDATYVWEHASFNPITHHMQCYIHFKFADGSRLRRAFSYAWRLWSLPEVSELLYEAGFKKVRVFWERFEESDEDGDYLEGTGEYYETDEVENQESWVSYIVAEA